ncbi:MAG: septation protein SpoVG family protein [Elusimicrobia bacterium]|nr:septation protein SpoVG family protein [Elusimicrobiota bacterium]
MSEIAADGAGGVEIEIRHLNPAKNPKNKNLLAMFDVKIGPVMIRGASLMNGKNGLFVGYPAKKRAKRAEEKGGSPYEDVVYVIGDAAKSALHEAVVREYEEKRKNQEGQGETGPKNEESGYAIV